MLLLWCSQRENPASGPLGYCCSPLCCLTWDIKSLPVSPLGWDCHGQRSWGHWSPHLPWVLIAVSTHHRLPGFGRSWRLRRSQYLRGLGPLVPGGPKTGWAPHHVALPHQTRAASGTLFWARWQLWWPSCSTCSILWCPRVAGDELACRQLP